VRYGGSSPNQRARFERKIEETNIIKRMLPLGRENEQGGTIPKRRTGEKTKNSKAGGTQLRLSDRPKDGRT